MPTTIQIKSPCSQAWDEMTPSEKGRFCLSCAKAVVDFSRLSDKEILAYLHSQQGDLCGRFHKGQLNRPLVVPAPPKKSFVLPRFISGWLALTALPFLTAQCTTPSIETASIPPDDNVIEPKEKSSPIVQGKVIDENKAPIEGAIVSISETISTVTDTSGHYTLLIPDTLLRKSIISLRVSSVGYHQKEIQFDKSQLPIDLDVVLQEQELGVKGEIAIEEIETKQGEIGNVVRPRKRNFFQRLFR